MCNTHAGNGSNRVNPINSNHFSFCLLFNEEYEINYDSRVVALDQIRVVFIKIIRLTF